MEGINITVEDRLDFWTCFFLNSKDHLVFTKGDRDVIVENNKSDDEVYAPSPVTVNQPMECHKYFCKAYGASITGSEQGGKVMCILLCCLILMVGLFGVVTNVLNVIILRKCFPGKSPVAFKESLVLLSLIELVLCIGTIGFSYYTILIMENLSRGLVTIHLFQSGNLTFTVARTMSVYITLLITLERLLVVAFPTKAKAWFYDKPLKSRIALAVVLVYSFLLNFPWIVKSSIVENEYAPVDHDDKMSAYMSDELMGFPYVITRNAFAKNFNRELQETLLALDFVVPFPLLLLFNALMYRSIYSWNKARATLSGRQKSDINAAKMFSVVALLLLSCHSVSCAVFFTSRVQNVIYRELILLQNLAVVFGASANFLVYYYFKAGYQSEFWACMRVVFGDRFSWINKHYEKFRKASTEVSHYSQNS